MIKDYIKEFDTNSEYQSYIAGDPVLPNVSYIVETNVVEFNPWVEPMNIITYEASAKLVETTSDKNSGLHTNAFNTTIKSHTFENGVGTIEFNNDVTSIGNKAFNGCTGLTSITIPDSVISIGSSAFQECSSLTSVTIPDSVTSIGTSAFSSCRKLTSVTIGSGVTSIGNQAFGYCDSLTNITIPSGVTSIGQTVFQGCMGLTNLVVDSANTVYDSRNNCNAIIETSTNQLVIGCKSTVIPNTVTSIGQGAFNQCSGLTSITIPNSVTSIGNQAFNACYNLTSVTIPDSVTSIGNYAFISCGLTSVTIGNSVTIINNSAFQYCSSLTSITCNATTAPTIQSSTFQNVKTGGTLTVPTGSTGYNVWMGTDNYYLGQYNWTKVEQ